MDPNKQPQIIGGTIEPSPPNNQIGTIHPAAAAQQQIYAAQNSTTVSARTPELQKYALLFLALLVVSVLVQFAQLAIRFAMNDARGSFMNAYIRQEGILPISVTAMLFAAGIVLLFTKSLNTARIIVLFAGLCFIYFGISSLFQLDFIGLAVSGFILWRLYEIFMAL